MKKTIRYSIQILLVLGVGRAAWAQGVTKQLSITQAAGFKVCPDTAYLNQSVTVQFHLKNVGQDTIFTSDTIDVIWRNQDTSVTVFQTTLLSQNLQNDLEPNDSAVFQTTYIYDSTHYKQGSNIVVVWPRVGNSVGSAADSLFLNVCFDPFLTLIIQNNADNQYFILSPNPAAGEFTVLTGLPETIEYVRIFETSGRLCLAERYRGRVNLSALPRGLYLVEIGLHKREAMRRKLLKL